MGVEDEAALIKALQQHQAGGWTRVIRGGNNHRVGFAQVVMGIVVPRGELFKRRLLKVVKIVSTVFNALLCEFGQGIRDVDHGPRLPARPRRARGPSSQRAGPDYDESVITIPEELLPADGRFGAGPARIRPEQMTALADAATTVMGTSHRQAPVKSIVGRIRAGLTELYNLPEGYEVVLGNGGSTAFWDAASFGLVRRKAAHGSFGEFGSKFAKATDTTPFLDDSAVFEAQPGEVAVPTVVDGADVYAWPHNETSTGAAAPVRRPVGIADDALVAIDATSAAGGLDVGIAETDVYYFAPQKNMGSDGGLWIAIMSSRAIERARSLKSFGRWIPASMDLVTAIDNSAKNQTYNTPAVATLIMLAEQIDWINGNGGLKWAAERTATSAGLVYDWAEKSDVARPFVENPDDRSNVVCTIDFDESVDAAEIAKTLRANGVVDVEPYRKLGRNQLRIATFVSVPPEDIKALLDCIDFTLSALRG